MPTRRTMRVGEIIRQHLHELISRSLDFEGQVLTLTDVDVSPDLKNAYIFISVLDPKHDRVQVMKLLNKNRLDWQKEITKRLPIKNIPRLNFRFNAAQERGDRVMDILREIEENAPDSPPAADGAEPQN